MRYHDGVDDEDETYHKTEWSLPPYGPQCLIVWIMLESSWSISLLSFYVVATNQQSNGRVWEAHRQKTLLSSFSRNGKYKSAICCAEAEFRNGAVRAVSRAIRPIAL